MRMTFATRTALCCRASDKEGRSDDGQVMRSRQMVVRQPTYLDLLTIPPCQLAITRASCQHMLA